MRIEILGPLRVVDDDGTVVRQGGPKERALLVRLALAEGHTVAIERLIDDVWAGTPPPTARQGLHVQLSRVRKVIGAHRVVTEPGGYRLDLGTVTIDARHFGELVEAAAAQTRAGDHPAAARTLRQALSLWRGSALADLADEEFAHTDALRLDEARLAAIEARVEADLACGEHAALVPELDALTTTHPLRERLWAARMTALYRAGRQADALRAYQAVRRLLADELGLEPGPELRALEQQILDQDPSLATPSGQSSAVGAGEGLPSSLQVVLDGPFVGREGGLAILREALDGTGGGRAQAVLIGGEPGIGKTRLAAEAARQAHAEGVLVLFGRCQEDLGVPYEPFIEALRQLLRRSGPGDSWTRHSGELARLIPEVAGAPPDGVPMPVDTDAASQRYRLFEGVAAVLEAASANRPLLLVLDDLQWATEATAQLLTHLLASSRSLRLAVVATYRDTEVDDHHPLHRVLGLADRMPGINRLALSGLDPSAVDAYLHLSMPSDAAAPADVDPAELARRTGGNPFVMVELLRHRVAHGEGVPATVAGVIARQLSLLSATTATLLECAAVAGPLIDLPLLVGSSSRPEAEVVDALDEALGTRVVVDHSPGRYAFAHDLIRDAILASLSSVRRASLHRKVADALDAAPDATARLDALAFHLGECSHLNVDLAERAAAATVDLAWAMWSRAAAHEAHVHFERAVAILADSSAHREDLHASAFVGLAATRQMSGDFDGALVAIRHAADHALASGSAAHLALATQFAASWTDPRAAKLAEELGEAALACVGEECGWERSQVLGALSMVHSMGTFDARRAAREADDAVALARKSARAADNLEFVLVSKALANLASPDVDAFLALCDEIAAHEQGRGWNSHMFRAVAHLRLGNRSALEHELGAHADIANRYQLGQEQWRARTSGALLATVDGRFDDAQRLISEAGAYTSHALTPMISGQQLGMLMFERGQEEALLQFLEAAARGETPMEWAMATALLLARARLGRVDELKPILDARFLAIIERGEGVVGWQTLLASMAEVVCVADDAAKAAALEPYVRPFAGQLLCDFNAVCTASGDRAIGQVLATQGRLDEAVERYSTGLALEERAGALALATRTRLWLGRALLARGADDDRREAAQILADATTDAEALGMARVAVEAASLLRG